MRHVVAAHLAALLLALAAGPAAAQVPTGNLVQNPGAEIGPASDDTTAAGEPDSWLANPNITQVRYGASGFPTAFPGSGLAFFTGGPTTVATQTMLQSIQLDTIAAEIDAGRVVARVSALLGGFDVQEDRAGITLEFRSVDEGILGTVEIPPVTVTDRGGVTQLLPRSGEGRIPANTRYLNLVVRYTYVTGAYTDGYVDNLAVTLLGPPQTSISDGPTGPTSDDTPTWTFEATPADASTTYECRIDSDPFAACTSPYTAPALARGNHTLEVRATNTAATDDTPASRDITVLKGPVAHTSGVDGVTTTGARAFGTLDDRGVPATYHFEYGPTTAFGTQTADVTSAGAAGEQAVSATLAGLTPDSDYHVRLVANGPDGAVAGEDIAFHTARTADLAGLPAGLDFTWDPRADVLVAGAPSGGVQFRAPAADGVTYAWDFDHQPAAGFRPQADGPTPRRGFTADGAHDGAKVYGADGTRRRLYRVRLRAVAANGASAEIGHDIVVMPNLPPQVDFLVEGDAVNSPTVFTPEARDTAGPRVADRVDHVEWDFDPPVLGHVPGDPRDTDLVCAADGSACAAPGGGPVERWFGQGNGRQAAVNFYERALAAHGLPSLGRIDVEAQAPGNDATELVLDAGRLRESHRDPRVAFLYDHATLLQQSSFDQLAGEATGARLARGGTIARAARRRASRGPGASAAALSAPSLVATANSDARAKAVFAAAAVDWRRVTLTAVDTAGARASRSLPVVLRPDAPPTLRAKFVDPKNGTTIKLGGPTVAIGASRRARAAQQVVDHPITTKDELRFSTAGTEDPEGKLAYYTLEVGLPPLFCRGLQNRVSDLVAPGGATVSDGFNRPAAVSAVAAGLAAPPGTTGSLAGTAKPVAAATGRPSLATLLARRPVVHSCAGTLDRRVKGVADNAWVPRNVEPVTVRTGAVGAARRPPADGGLIVPGGISDGVEAPTRAIVTKRPEDLRVRIPNPGTYSVAIGAYDVAGLGATQRTDGFEIVASEGKCLNVKRTLTILGGRKVGLEGACMTVAGNQTRYYTGGSITINGVTLEPSGSAGIYIDAPRDRSASLVVTRASYDASRSLAGYDAQPGDLTVTLDGDAIGSLSSARAERFTQFLRNTLDPRPGGTYRGSPVSEGRLTIAFGATDLGSTATFDIVLPREFNRGGGPAPTGEVVRRQVSAVQPTLLTTKRFAEIARRRRARAAAAAVSTLDLSGAQLGPLSIEDGKLTFNPDEGRWDGDIRKAYLTLNRQYPTSLKVVIADGALREAAGSLGDLRVPVFAGVFLDGVRFSVVPDPLAISGGADFTAYEVLTGSLDITVKIDPLFLRLEGRIGLLGIPLANAFVQYDEAAAQTLSFGGKVGYDFGPASLDVGLNGAISLKTKEFFVQGDGRLCVFICLGAHAIASSIAIAACGEVDLVLDTVSAGAAYRFGSGISVFTGCDLNPYKPAVFSRAAGAGVGTLSVPPGTQQAAFRFRADPGSAGAPDVTLVAPDGTQVSTAPAAGDYAFTPVAPVVLDPAGAHKEGQALVDRDVVDHVTTVILASPRSGAWKFSSATPLIAAETASGLHLETDAFAEKVASADLDGRRLTISGKRIRGDALTPGSVPEIEESRLRGTVISVPPGLTGELQLIDVGPTASKVVGTIELDGKGGEEPVAFVPTAEPGRHELQAIKIQPGTKADGGALPQRAFVVGRFTAAGIVTPTAPDIDLRRRGREVLAIVDPGPAGSPRGAATTFELAATLGDGQRIERLVDTRGVRSLPGGRFSVSLGEIPRSTSVRVSGRMRYAGKVGRAGTDTLRR